MADNLELVLFDVGGTLAGADNMFESMAIALSDKRINGRLIEDRFITVKNRSGDIGFSDVQTLLRLVAGDVSKSFDIDIKPDMFTEIYRHIYTETVYLYDGVTEILEYLKNKNVEMVVVSDADADVIRPQLRRLNIDGYFSDLIISSDVQAYKPDDILCNLLIDKFKTDKRKTVMIGDSYVDIATAEKVHADSIYIGDKATNATHTVSCTKEALPVFKGYFE